MIARITPRSPLTFKYVGRFPVVILLLSLAHGADPGTYPRDDRDAAREWFWQWWLKGHSLTTGFTGSYEAGVAGQTSAEWREAMETRVNLFRRMTGMSPVTTSPELNRICQLGAIIMPYNQTHHPKPADKNYSVEGAQACRQSLLTSGWASVNPVMDLIYDGGVGGLGHRTAILTPGLKRVGFGAAYPREWAEKPEKTYSFLLHTSDPSYEDVDPNFTEPFVLWPARGWMPTRLIPANWLIAVSDLWSSVGGTELDLRNTSVQVWRNGIKLPVAGGPDQAGGGIIFALDGTDVMNTPAYKEGGSGNVVDGVQTPKTAYFTNEMLFGHDLMHGELTAYGLNRDIEDPFGDVIYDVKVSGIRVRTSGALWNGSGVYEYQVRGFDLQTPGAVSGQAKLINISTRSPVKTGAGVQIAGFVVGGTTPRKVLVRASGPALELLGVADTLPDPLLSVYRLDGATRTLVGANDNWGNDAATAMKIEGVSAAVGAFPWSRGSKDAALVLTLAPGNYTGVVEGAKGESGNGLIEVYDAESADDGSKVVNISSRTYVGDTPSGYQIAGFVLKGEKPRSVLVRVTGRDLEPFGVTDVLNYCQFELYAGKDRVGIEPYLCRRIDVLHSRLARVSKEVGAFELADRKGASVGLFTLTPNVPYTVVVRASSGYAGLVIPAENKKGNALIEVYELN
ncbi:MAG: CAP domain-containing protein [Opitutaceae bacterium]|nr:CAP domain-containing protein [Opitutaceae bacterium]